MICQYNGYVGIGTTTPTERLHVDGSACVKTLSSIYGDNNYFAGNVGIGITAPTTKLDVAGGIRSTDGSNIGIVELGETAQSNKAGGAVRGERSPSYSSTGKLSLQTATWGSGSDYNLTTQLSIENKGADTKAAQVLIAPWGGCVGIGISGFQQKP